MQVFGNKSGSVIERNRKHDGPRDGRVRVIGLEVFFRPVGLRLGTGRARRFLIGMPMVHMPVVGMRVGDNGNIMMVVRSRFGAVMVEVLFQQRFDVEVMLLAEIE